MSDQKFYTPNELAEEMGISPKSLRRFLRSITDERAGSGNRWKISAEMADQVKAIYARGGQRKVTEFVIRPDVLDVE